MILQTQLPEGITESFIEKWGAYGALLILTLIGIYLLIRYISKRNKEEREQLIKDKCSNEQKVEVLYTEIKELQNDQIEKYAEMKVKDHEIQKEMVSALNNNTSAFKELYNFFMQNYKQ